MYKYFSELHENLAKVDPQPGNLAITLEKKLWLKLLPESVTPDREDDCVMFYTPHGLIKFGCALEGQDSGVQID